jgi:hypothetical protein
MTINTRAHNQTLLTLVAVALAMGASAQEPGQPVVNSRIRQAEATVQTINPATREVSLTGSDGPFSVVVGPDVKNLGNVRVGDKVVVSYYVGVAAQMAKGATKATDPALSSFDSRTPSNGRPGGLTGDSVTTRVIIEDVDPGTNTVAFKRSDGSVHIIAVKAPNMQKFIRTLKRGDAVDVTYTESLAVNIVPSRG